MAKKHTTIVDSLFKTMTALEKTVKDQQQIIENMESKKCRQGFVLACLNQENDKTARELMAKDQLIIKRDQRILQLPGQEQNHFLKNNSVLLRSQDKMRCLPQHTHPYSFPTVLPRAVHRALPSTLPTALAPLPHQHSQESIQ